MILWWKSSIIIIVSTTKIAIIIHDQIMKKYNHLTIFTNDINIDNQIEAFATTIIFFNIEHDFHNDEQKQIYLKFITKITIYFEKIMKLDFVLNVTENHFKNRLIVIFTNCQVVIRAIQCLKKQFDQHLLQTLIWRIEQCDREIHIY